MYNTCSLGHEKQHCNKHGNQHWNKHSNKHCNKHCTPRRKVPHIGAPQTSMMSSKAQVSAGWGLARQEMTERMNNACMDGHLRGVQRMQGADYYHRCIIVTITTDHSTSFVPHYSIAYSANCASPPYDRIAM